MPYLKLVRVGTLFSPAADVTAGLCLAGLLWSADAVCTAIASILLYAGGMVLNDFADRAEDARVRPERPLPRGDIKPAVALMLGLALLGGSLALAPDRRYYGAMAVLVVGYDFVVKRQAWLGALNMGALRAMNLLAPAVILADVELTRPLLIAGGVYALYIIAVTILGILEDEPHAPHRAVRSVQMIPPCAAALALLAMPNPTPAAWIGIALATIFVMRAARVAEWTQANIRQSMTWLLLGTMLYTGLLCLSAERYPEAAAVFAVIWPARWISRRIALT